MAGAAQVRRVLAAFVDQGVKVNLGFYTGLLAQLEAETLGADSALARIDEAFRPLEPGRTSLLAPLPASPARRNPAQARPARSRSGRGSIPDVNRHREGAGRAQSRSSGVACRSPSSTNRPAAPSKPTPSSRPRSKALRRRPKCPRSPRRCHCRRGWRRSASGRNPAVPGHHIGGKESALSRHSSAGASSPKRWIYKHQPAAWAAHFSPVTFRPAA